MLGTVYKLRLQPLEPADTNWVQAGARRFGVAYRDVDPAALAATYGQDAAANDGVLMWAGGHLPTRRPEMLAQRGQRAPRCT